MRARDLWSELRERGRRFNVDVDRAERELNEAEERWLRRLGQ